MSQNFFASSVLGWEDFLLKLHNPLPSYQTANDDFLDDELLRILIEILKLADTFKVSRPLPLPKVI